MSVPIDDTLELSAAQATEAARILMDNLRTTRSVAELVLTMFRGDGDAADRYIGVGAAVSTVQGGFEGEAFASMAMERSAGGGLLVGLQAPEGAAPADAEAAGESTQPTTQSTQWTLEHYNHFCTPTPVSSATAYRRVGKMDMLDRTPRAVRLEQYQRTANDAAAPDLYPGASDLWGHVKAAPGTGRLVMRTRGLEELTHAAAANASVHLLRLEKHGTRQRLDATYQIPPTMDEQGALAFALGDAAALLRRGLVTTPRQPVLQYMSSAMCSLFALHWGALRAVQRAGASPLHSLAAYLCLSQTAACVRNLHSGRTPGNGVPGPALATALGVPPAGALPPPPMLVARELGLPEEQAAAAVQPLQGGAGGGTGTDYADVSAAIAARHAKAYAAPVKIDFACRYTLDTGTPCGATFSTKNLLHKHLTDKGHHTAPPAGGFAVEAVRGSDIVTSLTAGLGKEQYDSIMAVLATGRHTIIAGAAGSGKSVTARALVHILRRLYGEATVAFLHPTTMSAHATADPDATTLHAAAGFGKPANNDTLDTIIRRSAANSDITSRLQQLKYIVLDEFGRTGYREVAALFGLLRMLNSDYDVKGLAGQVQVILAGDLGQTLDFTTALLKDDAKAETPTGLWLRTPLGDEFNPLVFDFKSVWRQADGEFVRHLFMTRSGQPWQAGHASYDFFMKHCSPDLDHNRGMSVTEQTGKNKGRQRVSHEAIEKGYTVLVATNKEANEANNELREEARAKAPRGTWRELTINAMDGMRGVTSGKVTHQKLADPEDKDGSGAPPYITFYPKQAVAVAKGTSAVRVDNGAKVTLPSSLIGIVEDFKGTCLDDVVVTVFFPASEYGPAVRHQFKAEDVDEPEEINGRRKTRRMVQLRDGRFLTIHRAQSLSLELLIVDLWGAGGVWCTALVYTALSRGRTLLNLIILNHSRGYVRANTEELAWITARAAETQAHLAAQELVADTPLVVRDVASFLANRLRNTEDAAAVALRALGSQTRAHFAVLKAVGVARDEEVKLAGAKRMRRSAPAAGCLSGSESSYSGSDSSSSGSDSSSASGSDSDISDSGSDSDSSSGSDSDSSSGTGRSSDTESSSRSSRSRSGSVGFARDGAAPFKQRRLGRAAGRRVYASSASEEDAQ